MRLLIGIYIAALFCLMSEGGSAWAESQSGEHGHGPDTIWTCSMHPQIQLPEAGQCPICFMDLIEVVKEAGADRDSLRQISFDDRARKLAEVEVQPVRPGKAATEIRMVGKVDYDETRLGSITSWVNGRIDKLFVDYTGSRVRKGQPMVKVYSPELITAQAELIQALAAFKRGEQSEQEIIRKSAERTLEASREKLRLLGLSDKQLRAIEKLGNPTEHITLTAPLSGIVIRKDVNEGMYVKTGSPIYTVADLGRVWVVLEAYESDLHAITLGQQVQFSVESYPGLLFLGEVAYIDPIVDSATRTVQIRLNVDNQGEKLKPGMFVRATSSLVNSADQDELPLLVPAAAPLLTGKRALVYVQPPDKPGVYVGREVVLGNRHGDFYQVKSGLSAGELVVTRGNFKIDSAIQLQAGPSMMNPYFADSSRTEKVYPGLFISQLNIVNRNFAELSKGIHENSRTHPDEALEIFRSSIDAVSGDNLQPEDRLSWQEYSMLLGSDIVLLSEAENSREREQMYAALAVNFQHLRDHFDLDDVAATRLGTPALHSQLNGLLASYLKVEQYLAADDLASVKKEEQALVAAAKIVAESLQETGEDLAARLSVSLTEDIARFVLAQSLDEVRSAFYPFSENLIRIVETFGGEGDYPIFVHYCPMAFDNKGATWMAASEEISNPYFGAMMLRCGEVRKQLRQ